MTWVEPIYNRKQDDVDYVRYLNNKIAKNGLASLSSRELTEWVAGDLIGSLNFRDLNRIESNIQYLSAILNVYGYNQSMTHKLNWTITDFPYLKELRRIIFNIQVLIDAYHHPMLGGMCWADLEQYTWADLEQMSWASLEPIPIDLPDPAGQLDYVKVNNMERLLFELKDMVRRMELELMRCGTFSCGEGYDL